MMNTIMKPRTVRLSSPICDNFRTTGINFTNGKGEFQFEVLVRTQKRFQLQFLHECGEMNKEILVVLSDFRGSSEKNLNNIVKYN